MRRENKSLVLIDPVPPRVDAPPVIEMDVARIIQSIYGWEHALNPEKWVAIPNVEPYIHRLFYLLPKQSRKASFYWAAYNCGRIIKNNADDLSVTWARNTLPLFLKELQCDTSLI